MTTYGASMMKALNKRLVRAMAKLERKYGFAHGLYSDTHPRNIVLNRWYNWKARQRCW